METPSRMTDKGGSRKLARRREADVSSCAAGHSHNALYGVLADEHRQVSRSRYVGYRTPSEGALAVDTDWIDAVMRMNEAIVAAEARFKRQVIEVIRAENRGQDTIRAEARLTTCQANLNLLRGMQSSLLGTVQVRK